LLSQRGPARRGTAIRLPSDPLYEYDSADLQPGAATELQKLATIIKRNPNAKFTIEGYSDTFGTAEYNYQLSQRRADSVAEYLVTVLGVNPAQVQARGFGPTKLLVTPRAIDPTNPAAVTRRSRGNGRIGAWLWLLIPAADQLLDHQFLIHRC
jgi:outer membrane protein OmpA-like peptidoglycan-associated protein